METEEFELVPASPIKRLEKKIKKLERLDNSSSIKKLTEHMVDLIDSNQKVVETMVNSNNELRREMSKLPEKIDDMVDEIKSSFRRIKSPTTNDIPIDSLDILLRQMGELINHNRNHLAVSHESLDNLYQINKRLKRIYLHNAQIARRVNVDGL